MKYAVVGLGDFGKALALKLARRGEEVIAVDNDLDRVDDVKNEVSLAVRLDATDENDLRAQGIDRVNVLVAAIGENFEANQLVVVLAKRLGILRVIARAANPIHARILTLIGADDVIQPEEEAAEKLYRRLLYPSVRDYVELLEGYSVAEVEVTAAIAGKNLAELNFPKRYGVNLIAIRRREAVLGASTDASVNLVPKSTDVLEKTDVIVVAGKDGDVGRLLEDVQGKG